MVESADIPKVRIEPVDKSHGRLALGCWAFGGHRWPEQADRWGDHFYPSGTVIPFSYNRSGAATFGKGFVAGEDLSPERGRWYCYEFMVRANTVGQRDGRIGMWLDGRLVGDFPNLRLRDVDSLRIDRFGLGLYIAENTDRANRKWHDDVVAARSYIGPMAAAEKAGP